MNEISNTILIVFLFVTAFIDYRTKKIPVLIFYMAICTGALLNFLQYIFQKEISWISILGGIGIGIIFFGIAKITKEAIGYGDCLLIATCGLYLGIEKNIEVLLYAFILSSVTGSILWIRKKKTKKDKIPFAPFVLGAFLISII